MNFRNLGMLLMLLFLLPKQNMAQRAGIAVSEINGVSSFPIVDRGKVASIYIDEKDAEVVGIAAEAFKDDIHLLTGTTSSILKNNPALSAYPIIIGTIGQSFYIDQLVKAGKINRTTLSGKWETFSISLIESPLKGVKRALVISGSDRRGTAYGVFQLSRMLGVSPLYWWADVKPATKKSLYVKAGQPLVESPSVKYRGIFINDEDWGIQPWAAKMMDTDVKDIGPKTYTRIFELLLRLKANYIWPGDRKSVV